MGALRFAPFVPAFGGLGAAALLRGCFFVPLFPFAVIVVSVVWFGVVVRKGIVAFFIAIGIDIAAVAAPAGSTAGRADTFELTKG